MAKETTRTGWSAFRFKRGGVGARTEELQREITAASRFWPRLIRSRNFILSCLIWVVFAAVVGVGAMWVRQQPMVTVGRVADQTRTVRVPFQVDDEQATEQARGAARQRAARVYVQVAGVIDEVIGSIEGFPAAIADVEKLDDVEPGLRERFRLTGDSDFAEIKRALAQPRAVERWRSATVAMRQQLERKPFVDQRTFQVEVTAINDDVELRAEGPTGILTRRERSREVRSIESAELHRELGELAAASGFSGVLLDLVVNRLLHQPRATYVFDEAATAAGQAQAAALVEPVRITYPDRSVIYRRGDVLTAAQVQTYLKAVAAERSAWPKWTRWLDGVATMGVVGLIGLALAGYTVLFCPRVRREPTRLAYVVVCLGAAALVAWWASVAQPGLVGLTATAPTVFVSLLLAIAYDRRSALAWGSLHGLLVCIGLSGSVAGVGEPVALFCTIVTGVGVAMWTLRELRDRESLIRTGVWTGLGLGGATIVTGCITLPLVTMMPGTALGAAGGMLNGLRASIEQILAQDSLGQILRDAGFAAFGGPLVAAITLFILPSIERWFDITTGMTLTELRDPRNPLLRMLQQRAPGTYNHSLNLASLAEAAAEAIGADSLLTYVGALYHDIGKMNKPEYFVENQTPGINKHDKLSPAMSLLIIVGHVKDGMELAREFGLPRPLWHFIESHHGTTLVEYFYHRAKKQAEREALLAGLTHMDMPTMGAGGTSGAGGGGGGGPSEIEYRYPGPKPATKEAAIIMLCDAVESASRAMADPTPSRIDATVRAIANKRLMDGQFDDCDLTLRDLNVIVEAVSKTLAAIYHGRIAYPTGPTARPGGGPSDAGQSGSGQMGAGAGLRSGTILMSSKRMG